MHLLQCQNILAAVSMSPILWIFMKLLSPKVSGKQNYHSQPSRTTYKPQFLQSACDQRIAVTNPVMAVRVHTLWCVILSALICIHCKLHTIEQLHTLGNNLSGHNNDIFKDSYCIWFMLHHLDIITLECSVNNAQTFYYNICMMYITLIVTMYFIILLIQ